MDDFPGLFARDFGFKPQGKSAPMAPPRNPSATSYDVGSSVRSSNSYFSDKSSAPIFDDHDRGDDLLFTGGPPKRSEPPPRTGPASSFDYDSIFKDQNDKSSSGPVFDKPLYDDEEVDIFDGLPGLKTASAGPAPPRYEDVFASIGSSPKVKAQKSFSSSASSPLDDLLGNLGKKETAEQTKRPSSRADSPAAAFEDLLPVFGRSSSSSVNWSTSVPSQSQKASSDLGRTDSPVREDPFVVLQSAPSAPPSDPGLFTDRLEQIGKSSSTGRTNVDNSHVNKGIFDDPLEQIGKFSSTGRTNVDNSHVKKGMFDDLDPLENLGRSVPSVSSEINERGSVKSPLRSTSTFDSYPPTTKETIDKYPLDDRKGHSQREVPITNYHEPGESVYDVLGSSTDFHKSTDEAASFPSYVGASGHERNFTTRSEGVSEPFDDIWLTVSEIPLFTQPTSAPPPARPPPPRPPRISKSETGSFSSLNSRRKVHEYAPFSNSSPYSQVPSSARSEMNPGSSQLDELDDFAMGRTWDSVGDNGAVFYGDDVDTSSAAASAAAMKEAMDKAEAKFRQMRERETLKTSRIKEAGQVDKDMQETQQRDLRERQEIIDRERQQKEREEEEREQRRLEKEREHEEKEREQRRLEREREKARQAVERATREARERAATEARLKAERAAVGKAAAEARERAGRAAVQRAQAEARERAAAEAKERAERAAAEARERANSEAREREAMEKAAAAKAEAEARRRAERAAVERAAAEARQRAAAEARERAAAAARAQQRSDNQTKNENDLESFFSRASSAPRSRASSSDPFFDTVSKGSEASGSSSVGSADNMRKASSTSNFVDDLSSIFGGATQAGEFQDVEGETEERRRARLERHQRTQERAAKALAEKNQRDLQAQREQAERHRIAETLDVEIKRWAAGKEGNLRALLSTLQYVLWPECGWQPVSLTDLITAAAVKKVYRKATLCIHPDKVQQKGATLQQKYVAEKVFDLLKEAWNKFNSEELF